MNIKKASFAYTFAASCYYLFDYVYMPWLEYRFAHWVFVPLYFSIVIANFLGVYAYDFFQEDVLFIELGKNWIAEIKQDEGCLRKMLRIKWVAFVVLSIFPSPIASYLFFRKSKNEHPIKIISIISIASIPCTLFWGCILDLVGTVFRKLTWMQIGELVIAIVILFFMAKSVFAMWINRRNRA